MKNIPVPSRGSSRIPWAIPDLGGFLTPQFREALYAQSEDQLMSPEIIETTLNSHFRDEVVAFLPHAGIKTWPDRLVAFIRRVAALQSAGRLRIARDAMLANPKKDGQLALVAYALYAIATRRSATAFERELAELCFSVPFARLRTRVSRHATRHRQDHKLEQA